MNIERERKFLINPSLFPRGLPAIIIWAGYFTQEPAIRIALNSNGKAKTCFKTGSGVERTEVEYVVTKEEALHLLNVAPCLIQKIRYEVDGWEVDQFLGVLDGLWVAEFEERPDELCPSCENKSCLANCQDPIKRYVFPTILPAWLGEEVTLDNRYNNSWLAFNGIPARNGTGAAAKWGGR